MRPFPTVEKEDPGRTKNKAYEIHHFSFFSLLSLNHAFGQLVSVKELVLLINSNDNTAEKKLNSKGFVIYKFDSTDNYTKTSFAFNKNPNDNNADAFVAIANFFNGNRIVSLDFNNVTHFTNEKDEAEKLGFKFVKTEMPSAKQRYHEYKKGNLILTFWTNTYTPSTQYEIALTKK